MSAPFIGHYAECSRCTRAEVVETTNLQDAQAEFARRGWGGGSDGLDLCTECQERRT